MCRDGYHKAMNGILFNICMKHILKTVTRLQRLMGVPSDYSEEIERLYSKKKTVKKNMNYMYMDM